MQVVNTFMAALAGGQLEAARQLMTPDAVVMANGHVLGERDAYIDGAAKGDAAALRTVQRELLRRDVKAGADLGWVVSEKPASRRPAPKATELVVTETMLLAKTAEGLEDHPHPLVGPTRRLTPTETVKFAALRSSAATADGSPAALGRQIRLPADPGATDLASRGVR